MDNPHCTITALQTAIARLVGIRVKILYGNEWVQYSKRLICPRGAV